MHVLHKQFKGMHLSCVSVIHSSHSHNLYQHLHSFICESISFLIPSLCAIVAVREFTSFAALPKGDQGGQSPPKTMGPEPPFQLAKY